jgi:predicted TIM-barrel fold metal-dependent hydrolase
MTVPSGALMDTDTLSAIMRGSPPATERARSYLKAHRQFTFSILTRYEILRGLLANKIGQLIANLGADRLMFGTGMPFNYPDPALVKLEVLDATEPDKEKIRSQNAANWLRL